MFVIAVLFEVILFGFIMWGYLHEEKFVEFEDRLIANLKAYFKHETKRRKIKVAKILLKNTGRTVGIGGK